MNTYEEKIIETAREFPASESLEVINIATIRAERAEDAPVSAGNAYTRVLSHFEKGSPIFVWQNWGGV